jgi:hypothetical protein
MITPIPKIHVNNTLPPITYEYHYPSWSPRSILSASSRPVVSLSATHIVTTAYGVTNVVHNLGSARKSTLALSVSE